LALRRLSFLLKCSCKLSRIRLRRLLTAELASSQHTEHYWRQHHQKLLCFLWIEAACLLHTLLHRVAVLSEDPSEESACAANVGWWPSLQHAADVISHVFMIARCVLDGAGALSARRVARHTTDDHWQCGGDGCLGKRWIDAELLADLRDLILAEVLLRRVE